MKKLIFLWCLFILMGCEKVDYTCWKCTTTYYNTSNKQIGEMTEDICDKTASEIKKMEGQGIENISGIGQVNEIKSCKGIK